MTSLKYHSVQKHCGLYYTYFFFCKIPGYYYTHYIMLCLERCQLVVLDLWDDPQPSCQTIIKPDWPMTQLTHVEGWELGSRFLFTYSLFPSVSSQLWPVCLWSGWCVWLQREAETKRVKQSEILKDKEAGSDSENSPGQDKCLTCLSNYITPTLQWLE